MPIDLDDSNIAAGANIATSKLIDGVNFLKKDGSVAITGVLDFGNQQTANVPTPLTANAISNKAYVDAKIDALSSIFDSKPSAKAATTGNITITNPGTAIFDTITLSGVGTDILFVRNNTAPAENGLYYFNGSAAALTRVPSMDAWNEIPGAFFAVEQGATYADTLWLCTADAGGTLGTTAVTFFNIPTSGLSQSNFVSQETLAGVVNGSNVTFTHANTPIVGSEQINIGGVILAVGAGNDYTISGSIVTMLVAPLTGEVIRSSYRK